MSLDDGRAIRLSYMRVGQTKQRRRGDSQAGGGGLSRASNHSSAGSGSEAGMHPRFRTRSLGSALRQPAKATAPSQVMRFPLPVGSMKGQERAEL